MKLSNPVCEAHAFDPELGNEVIAGKVSADRANLRFESAEMRIEIPLQRILINLEEERVVFGDPDRPGLVVFTPDDTILTHWALVQSNRVRAQCKKAAVGRGYSRQVKITVYAVAVFLVIGWMASVVLGFMVKSAVMRFPAEWEAGLGDEAMEEVREEFVFVDDTNQVAELALMAAPLMRVIPAGKTEFKFYIVDDGEPNAFALPGGHVLVTRGLLEMMDRPEELLGVIAHEVAHVTRKHGLRQIVSGAGPILIMQTFMGDRSALNLLLARSGVLIYQTHSQKYEREADNVGWDYMVEANIDPRGMIDMLEKLKAWDLEGFLPGASGAFSSHPDLDKRIGWMEERWAGLDRKSGFVELTNSIPQTADTDIEERVRRMLQSR